MSRTAFAALALVFVVAGCERTPTAPALAGVSRSAAVSGGQSVTGSGTITFGASVEHLSVNVSGTSGRATFEDKAAGGNVNGQIDINCVTIVGNTATLSGIVTHSNDKTLIGREAVFQIMDNGDGTAPDFASLINFHDVGTGADCTIPGEFDLAPVKGNFTVTG